MIDPKELRIGNYVAVRHEDGIGIWPLADFSYNLNSLSFRTSDCSTTSYGYGVAVITPIELTSEILTEWCGFIEKHQPTFSGGYDYFMKFFEQADTKGTYSTRKFTISDKTGYVFLNDHFIGKCEYLHQLQNFIHTLFEIELEVNIPAKV